MKKKPDNSGEWVVITRQEANTIEKIIKEFGSEGYTNQDVMLILEAALSGKSADVAAREIRSRLPEKNIHEWREVLINLRSELARSDIKEGDQRNQVILEVLVNKSGGRKGELVILEQGDVVFDFATLQRSGVVGLARRNYINSLSPSRDRNELEELAIAGIDGSADKEVGDLAFNRLYSKGIILRIFSSIFPALGLGKESDMLCVIYTALSESVSREGNSQGKEILKSLVRKGLKALESYKELPDGTIVFKVTDGQGGEIKPSQGLEGTSFKKQFT